MLFCAALALAFVGPFLFDRKPARARRLWNFSKSAFLRICLAGFYAAVLLAGLLFALFSADTLFDLDVSEKRFGQLGVLVAALFTPWFILAGIPHPSQMVDDQAPFPNPPFPNPLRVFAQYALLPLMLLYAVILYAYAAKISLAGALPRGTVSSLVLGYGILGLLVTLLIFPIRKTAEHPLLAWFTRLFPYTLVLPLILLTLAIGRRIADYGLTEARLTVVALGLWLAFECLRQLFAKERLTYVAASFAVIALALGALATPLSVHHQYARLKQQLVHDGALHLETMSLAPLDRERSSGRVQPMLEFLAARDALATWEQWLKNTPSLSHTGGAIYEQLDTLGYDTSEPFQDWHVARHDEPLHAKWFRAKDSESVLLPSHGSFHVVDFALYSLTFPPASPDEHFSGYRIVYNQAEGALEVTQRATSKT